MPRKIKVRRSRQAQIGFELEQELAALRRENAELKKRQRKLESRLCYRAEEIKRLTGQIDMQRDGTLDQLRKMVLEMSINRDKELEKAAMASTPGALAQPLTAQQIEEFRRMALGGIPLRVGNALRPDEMALRTVDRGGNPLQIQFRVTPSLPGAFRDGEEVTFDLETVDRDNTRVRRVTSEAPISSRSQRLRREEALADYIARVLVHWGET